ncbi:MAG: amidohydrolase family protein [Spirochaetota bacterium]
MIIDTHVHVFDKRMGISQQTDREYFHFAGTSVEWLLTSMDYAGVDKASLISYTAEDISCCLPEGIGPVEFGSAMNREYVIEAVKKYPDRFYWFADHVDPRKDDYMAKAGENIDEGATGLKILSSFTGLFPDDPRLMQVYELCRNRHVPIILDFSFWYINRLERMPLKIENKDYRDFLGHVAKVAESFPDVNFQIAHYGSPENNKYLVESGDLAAYAPFIELMKNYNNLFTDLAALWFPKNEDYPFHCVSRFIAQLIRAIGADKVMFGTDWPYFCNGITLTYRQGLRLIREADSLKHEEIELILGRNALRFLGKRT